ncbi:MAG: pseudouridine-5'-phosphate glycosidase [Chloroflexota bacterium]|nr:pseudouridine-5'-phosphate glycosidase [Dehalococcoidia bacterium]MDW8254577.1 pseudouridine-5'-phosphate glycosidase [Chloroflexota bacterium]
MTAAPLAVLPDVRAALEARQPVVALETSVIAHGLPRPVNLEAAARMEAAVRAGGAVPAFIGVIEGVIRVGLDAADLERLAGGRGVLKIARRDLPAAAAFGETGGTTVSAALHVCTLTGITVFATGGIGGVHPGGIDVSEDLAALATTSAIVVCSGAKSILDLEATVERLETSGVLVAGLGVDELPAFYTRSSGLPVQRRVNSPAEAARLFRAARALGLSSAVLLAVPPPISCPLEEVRAIIAAAEDELAGIRGSARTPALLDAIGRRSGGRLTAVNVALLERNAALAAEVARAVAEQAG